MTWGMILPASFGDYWPNGAYVGDVSLAEDHYHNVLTDAERKKLDGGVQDLLANASRKFRMDIVFAKLGPLEEFEKPHEFKTVKTYKKLASFIKLNDGLLAVDEALRDIIEELEPGVHTFWPIEITMPRGVAYPTPYFAMVINNHLTAFSREDSEPGSWRESTPGDHYSTATRPYNKSFSGMAISREAVGSAHIWRERWVKTPNILFSDTLIDKIKAAGLRIPPTHYKMLDVEQAQKARLKIGARIAGFWDRKA